MTIGGLLQFFHLLAHSSAEMDATTKASINASLKNLLFFTHQNLLVVIQIMLNRMLPSGGNANHNVSQQSSSTVAKKVHSNYWASQLQTIINTKMVRKLRTKGEAVQLLKVHMQNSENIIKNIIKMQQSNGGKKKIFIMMSDWLNTITTVTNERIRETLYNIEQFRVDALNVTSVANANAAQLVGAGSSVGPSSGIPGIGEVKSPSQDSSVKMGSAGGKG
jgi:uncharacterized lipoprotein YmbA